MKKVFYISICFITLFITQQPVFAVSNDIPEETEKELNMKELILEHLADSYEWTIVSSDKLHLAVPLPVILHSKSNGWHFFMSSKFNHGTQSYNGFYIADEGKYKGKIVEKTGFQTEVRPLDLSLTKNATSLIFSSILLVFIIMGVARSLKRNPMEGKGGFVGMMELFINFINDDIIKPAVGKEHARYAPLLLTMFFFILVNNLLGIIPFFPGGANVTGNIAVTFILAMTTMLTVNLSGTKKYYKDILWPDVPAWLKVPVPLMPFIEIIGVFTKPFALMIRLFANITGGHSTILGLTSIVFITASMGAAINTSMTVLSVLFNIFINLVDLLVAFIQAYVFTMLSAVYIGLAREGAEEKSRKGIEKG